MGPRDSCALRRLAAICLAVATVELFSNRDLGRVRPIGLCRVGARGGAAGVGKVLVLDYEVDFEHLVTGHSMGGHVAAWPSEASETLMARARTGEGTASSSPEHGVTYGSVTMLLLLGMARSRFALSVKCGASWPDGLKVSVPVRWEIRGDPGCNGV